MKTTAAETAKMMRDDLKASFPGIKFSVKSNTYSGGNSVDVKWVDGPLADVVKKVVAKYQMGHFDGMTDSYEFSNRGAAESQVKFVFCDRVISFQLAKKYASEIKAKWGIEIEVVETKWGYEIKNDEWVELFKCYKGAVMHRHSVGSL